MVWRRGRGVGDGLRLSFSLGSSEAGDGWCLGDASGGGVSDADVVAVEGGGHELEQRCAVFRVGCGGGDERVLGDGEVSSLLQDVGAGGGAELVLLLFGDEALAGVVMLSLCGGYLGTVVGEGVTGVDDLDADLGIELLQTHLGLPELHLRTRLVSLCGAIAQWDGEVGAYALVGRAVVDEIVEGGAVADGREGAGRIGLASIEVEGAGSLCAAEAVATVEGEGVEHGEQAVLLSLDGDLVVLHVENSLLDLGVVGVGFRDQLLDGLVFFGEAVEGDAVGWNDGRVFISVKRVRF